MIKVSADAYVVMVAILATTMKTGEPGQRFAKAEQSICDQIGINPDLTAMAENPIYQVDPDAAKIAPIRTQSYKCDECLGIKEMTAEGKVIKLPPNCKNRGACLSGK